MTSLANTHGVHVDMGVQAAGLARTQTKGTQSLVLMQPRETKTVEAKAIEESNLLGDSAFYAWGAGKDRIEGPAWPLTKSLMRVYGNCSLDMEPVQDLADSWVFTARAVDHETGYSISRQFRQSKKWQVFGKFDEARKDDIRFQIGQSKALRNVALAFLPEWLVDRCMDAAKGGVKAKIEKAIAEYGQDKVVVRMIQRLGAIGVSEARLLSCMGRKALAALTLEDLVIVSGGIAAVEKGSDSAAEVFPDVKETPTGHGPDGLSAALGMKPAAADAPVSEIAAGPIGEAEAAAIKAKEAAAAPKPEPVAKKSKFNDNGDLIEEAATSAPSTVDRSPPPSAGKGRKSSQV